MRNALRAALGATVISLSLPAVVPAQEPGGAELAVDRITSAVDFTVSARMIFTVKRQGRFSDFSGVVAYNPADPGGTRVDLTVYTASVDTKDAEQDALLRSDGFFDVDRYPTMRFVSSSAVVRSDGGLDVTGDLTIRGVTRRMVVPVRVLPLDSPGGSAVARFETTFDIDRTEFGLVGRPSYKGMNVSIGRSVKIHLAIATSLSQLRR